MRDDGRNAALWSSRLLPFISTLASSDLDIEDLVVSVLSELPTDEFLMEVLAFCFPRSGGDGGKGRVDAKLRRIMARLRAANQSVASEHPQPLSVAYQLKSGLVLKNRSKAFERHSGRLHENFFEVSSEVKDLDVGSLLLEHDTMYFSFLETLFETILPPLSEPLQSVVVSDANRHLLPYLSEFHSGTGMGLVQETSPVACGLSPLLHSLIRWAQMPHPQTLPREPRSAERLESAGRKKLAQRRQSLGSTTTIRVNLSVPIIIGCLREWEESGGMREEPGGEGEESGRARRDLRGKKRVTIAEESLPKAIGDESAFPASEGESDVTDEKEEESDTELAAKRSFATSEEGENLEDGVKLATERSLGAQGGRMRSDFKLAFDGDLSAIEHSWIQGGVNDFKLLGVPDGVLQVRLANCLLKIDLSLYARIGPVHP